MGLVRVLLLAALLQAALPALGWELKVAFTNDLHAPSPGRLAALEPYIAGADLAFDAGDAWEEMYSLSGLGEAERTAAWMEEAGYDAMVLGNHDAYLGPPLVEILRRLRFPVVVTNLHGIPGVVPWVLLERKGLRILVLGFLGPKRDVYFPYPLWPKAELLDPGASARAALEVAPEHDLLIILAHMGLKDAISLAHAAPECDLLILGHDHIFLDEPVWAGTVPIVEAGHRAQAVGLVTLGPEGLRDYRLVRVSPPPTRSRLMLLWVAVLALLFLLLG